jgi:hypothetical protein
MVMAMGCENEALIAGSRKPERCWFLTSSCDVRVARSKVADVGCSGKTIGTLIDNT